MVRTITQEDAIDILIEKLPDWQKEEIVGIYLWEENAFDIQTRLNDIRGYKNVKVTDEE